MVFSPFMSSPRLRKQFETLFEHFSGQDSGTQLDDVTEILFCTRRNARIVLNKLEEEGWIEWHPAAGRGKLSQLVFKQNRHEVGEALAKRYLDEGKIGHALNVLDKDVSRLTNAIQNYLGLQQHNGKQVIRLPYYRPLTMLNPTKAMRRSELHIARQIFSGLTKLDENEQIQPDLAHHWELVTPLLWRFYIRPGVRFHNGEGLTVEHIIESLSELRTTNLFRHIDKVASCSSWVVDIHLTSDDHHLPVLLAELSAKILPPEAMRGDDFDLFPIGTGPYRVDSNDDKRLVLSAFDGYFGYRPLLDTVEVWVIDKSHSSLVFPTLSDPIPNEKTRQHELVELDPGCTYLLLNKLKGVAKDEKWARYLSGKLNSLSLYKQLPEDVINELGLIPAHGLKPGWYHQPKSGVAVDINELKNRERPVYIAYYSQHPTFPVISQCVASLLAEDGIKVEFIKYDLQSPKSEEVDIWIQPMGIATRREDAIAGWLLDYSDIEKMANAEDFERWRQCINDWRQFSDKPFPAREISRDLIEQIQIIPMFHCWMGISHDHCGTLQNAKCNALGWFDFSKVWVKPDASEQVDG